jgi:hypothetical protein
VSALRSALYEVTPQNNNFGNCGLFTSEMQQTSYISIPIDECPSTFPTTALSNETSVVFDLVHATSNKLTDPQYTAISCQNKGVFVTNNAFYAFKTSANGEVSVTISDYATTPTQQIQCAGQGIRLALYRVNSCPAGQQFPEPIQCVNFNGNQTIQLKNLTANTNYLLFTEGIRNTKAAFNAKFTGSALSNTPPPPQPIITAVFPNPVPDQLTINFGAISPGRYNVNIIDAAGRILYTASYQINTTGQVQKLPFKHFPAGIYFLRVTDEANKVVSKEKVMKRN